MRVRVLLGAVESRAAFWYAPRKLVPGGRKDVTTGVSVDVGLYSLQINLIQNKFLQTSLYKKIARASYRADKTFLFDGKVLQRQNISATKCLGIKRSVLKILVPHKTKKHCKRIFILATRISRLSFPLNDSFSIGDSPVFCEFRETRIMRRTIRS